MTLEAFLALSLYSFATSITPGPNNLMLLASGANFGLRRSVPHIFGIIFGFVVMTITVGLGLSAVERLLPGFVTWMRYISLAYMVLLAWRLAMSGSLQPVDGGRKAHGVYRRQPVPMGQSEGLGDGIDRHGNLHHAGEPHLECGFGRALF